MPNNGTPPGGRLPFIRRYWLAVLLQLVIIATIIAIHSYTLASGRPVLLKTAPVDPWDPLRGQYLNLSYEISRLAEDKVRLEGLPYNPGQQVWVTLRKGETYWNAVTVSSTRPSGNQAAAGDVVIGGRVMWAYAMPIPETPGQVPGPAPGKPPGAPSAPVAVKQPPPGVPTKDVMQVFLRYGIEQFYVPEGEGQKIESNRAVQLSVEAVVDARGRALVRRVFADGKELRWR